MNCAFDDTELRITGEEGCTGYFRCPVCNAKYEIDSRDGSILKVELSNGNVVVPIKSTNITRGKRAELFKK